MRLANSTLSSRPHKSCSSGQRGQHRPCMHDVFLWNWCVLQSVEGGHLGKRDGKVPELMVESCQLEVGVLELYLVQSHNSETVQIYSDQGCVIASCCMQQHTPCTRCHHQCHSNLAGGSPVQSASCRITNF